jgi:hypothetical protein
MDIGQIRTLARQMHQDAADINSQIAGLTSQIESAPWSGIDREDFTRRWRETHVAALRRVVSSLEDASKHAFEYARLQEEASRVR